MSSLCSAASSDILEYEIIESVVLFLGLLASWSCCFLRLLFASVFSVSLLPMVKNTDRSVSTVLNLVSVCLNNLPLDVRLLLTGNGRYCVGVTSDMPWGEVKSDGLKYWSKRERWPWTCKVWNRTTVGLGHSTVLTYPTGWSWTHSLLRHGKCCINGLF